MFRPHPFSWRPGADRVRHATTQDMPRDGARFESLCGVTTTADCGEAAWLHPTCDACNAEAHRVAGVPMPLANAR
ncbi:hypothetical protein GCM10009854_07070 [Saccharopolyspora halophila]|uniref:Zinc finger protein n=1 Tax=Saccharopolyspora halophila TaxID=405551 RepID=A0ABP5SLI4_9PSEU